MVFNIDGIRNGTYANALTPFGTFSGRMLTLIQENPSPAIIPVIIVATLIFLTYKRQPSKCIEAPLLNQDVLKKIFMELDFRKMSFCGLVCKEWNQVVNNHALIKENIFQNFSFGPLHWNEFYGADTISNEEMEAARCLLKPHIFEILKSTCPAFPKKRIMETHMLVWIPEKIKGKVLTILNFGELQIYQYIWNKILEEVAELTVESGWVLISTNILPDSMNKSYDDQQSYVECFNRNGNVSWRVPRLAEAVVCISAKYLKMGITSNYEDHYTRSQERVGDFQLLVGDFNADGLYIGSGNSKCNFIGVNSYSNVAVRNKAS